MSRGLPHCPAAGGVLQQAGDLTREGAGVVFQHDLLSVHEPQTLGAPVGGAGKTNTPATAPPTPPATAPGVLTATTPPAPVRVTDVLAAADEARKAEARFAKLTVEMRDGVLVIGGSAPQPSDAWDFAAKLRTIPGVTRVAVGNVNGK